MVKRLLCILAAVLIIFGILSFWYSSHRSGETDDQEFKTFQELVKKIEETKSISVFNRTLKEDNQVKLTPVKTVRDENVKSIIEILKKAESRKEKGNDGFATKELQFFDSASNLIATLEFGESSTIVIDGDIFLLVEYDKKRLIETFLASGVDLVDRSNTH